MAEGNSGRRIGQGGLSGPLSPRERNGLYPNDVRPDRSGYPPNFAPPAVPLERSEEPVGDPAAANSTDLDIGLLLATDPAKAMEVLTERARKKGTKKNTT